MAVTRNLLLVGVVLLVADRSAVAAEVDHLRTVGSTAAVDIDRAVGDVVAVDSRLSVEGVVRGHIYAVDSEVTLHRRSVVLGSVTLHRGRLVVEPGAVLPPLIALNGSVYVGPGAERLRLGDELELEEGSTTLSLKRTHGSTASLELMKRVLPFDRFVPEPQLTLSGLDEWHPGLGLELRRALDQPEELTFGGVAHLTFISGKVRGAFQRGYRGPAGTVLVSAVHLQDEASAEALWNQIEAAAQRNQIRLSAKTGLGAGTHWFFKWRNRYCMMWQRSTWLLAVETRLADRDATLLQQVQFSGRVLRSLKQNLTDHSALSRGVQP